MDPVALWITGLPGSGKSVIAEEIKRLHPDFVLLRMDDLRRVVTPEPTYSETERDMVYRCLVYTAARFVELGHSVVIDATGNLRVWRELARKLIPGYKEIYLKCPLELCRERERKRTETRGAPTEIYRKGEAGWPVPGLTAPYEEPENPDLLIETDRTPVEAAVLLIEEYISRNWKDHSLTVPKPRRSKSTDRL